MLLATVGIVGVALALAIGRLSQTGGRTKLGRALLVAEAALVLLAVAFIVDRKIARLQTAVSELRSKTSVGYFAWWLNFCVRKKRHFDTRQVSFFDRMIFPCVHGFESRVCAPPFGQSLLAVARAC